MKNTKLIIDISALVPKEWIIETVDQNLVKVYYVNKGRGNSPKPFILPRKIVVDLSFVEAVAMYIGDGSLNLADLNHLSFCSIDKDMIKFMLIFFKSYFFLEEDNFLYQLRYHPRSEPQLKEWADYLNIDEDKIGLQQRKRSRHESFTLQIGGKILRHIFAEIIQSVLKIDFEQNQELRRAFLRGLFASEGGIGIQFKENYLAYLAFHLSYEKEEKLACFVQHLLEHEGIHSKHLTRKNKGERFVQITGWNNYYKTFHISLFDLNERKKVKFLNFLHSRTFYCKITPTLQSRILIGTSPAKIAKSLNQQYAKISKSLRKRSIETKTLLQISILKDLEHGEIRDNILALGMKGSSQDIINKEFIEYVFNMEKDKLEI